MNTNYAIPLFKGIRGKYSFLSNFHPVPIRVEDITYSSVEHAYQAMKTIDKEARKRISLMIPGQAKRAGKLVELRDGWEDMKITVMKNLLDIKFSNPELASLLLETGDEILEEGNNWRDTYWGVYKGQGSNHLGELLMVIRNELREDRRRKRARK